MRQAWAVAFGLLAVLFVSSCGGGGGGGGGDSLSYTGLTTPAVIDNTNAAAIARAAYEGGEWSDPSFAVPLGQAALDTEEPEPSNIIALVRTIIKIGDRMASGPTGMNTGGTAYPATVWRNSGTIEGSVSGYFTFSETLDDLTGDFQGSISFHEYDEGLGIVLNSGSVSISGNGVVGFDIYGPYLITINTFTLHFSSLSGVSGIGSFTLAGTVALVEGSPKSSATLDLVVRDDTTGKTVWIRDYTVVVSPGVDAVFGTYSEATVSGQIYLHDYGYVDIETIAPFRVYDTDLHPSSGELVVTGKAIGGGYCKARLYVVDNMNYEVYVDADGDGTYDGPPLSGTW